MKKTTLLQIVIFFLSSSFLSYSQNIGGSIRDQQSCVVTINPGDSIQSIMSSHPAGTVYCFAPGLYRLTSAITPKDGDVLRGLPGATLSGAVIITSWTNSNNKWYSTGYLPAPYKGVGTCEDIVGNPCLPGENIFYDGEELKRVMSADSVRAGTYFGDYQSNRIWIGSNPEGHMVEVAKTLAAIKSAGQNVTVSGLVIEKFATQAQSGAVQFSGSGWIVQNCEIRFNHGRGISDNGNDARIINNNIHHNGQLGIGGNRISGTIIEKNEIAFNNTDGFWVMDWEGGGIKFCRAALIISNNNVHDNRCVGIWLDIDCKGVTIENNSITDNWADGIRFEISYDGIIRGNVVKNNDWNMGRRKGTNLWYGAGINIYSCTNVDVSGNTVIDNLNGIGLPNGNRGSGSRGKYELVNVTVHNNKITMKSGVTGFIGSGGSGNSFSANTYYLESLSSARFYLMKSALTKEQWVQSGQDAGSIFNLIGSSANTLNIAGISRNPCFVNPQPIVYQ